MAIFRVPSQKHVIFPLFKIEITKLAEWRYSVCLIRNMSFFHFSSSTSQIWPNGDIPCARVTRGGGRLQAASTG